MQVGLQQGLLGVQGAVLLVARKVDARYGLVEGVVLQYQPLDDGVGRKVEGDGVMGYRHHDASPFGQAQLDVARRVGRGHDGLVEGVADEVHIPRSPQRLPVIAVHQMRRQQHRVPCLLTPHRHRQTQHRRPYHDKIFPFHSIIKCFYTIIYNAIFAKSLHRPFRFNNI